MSPNERSEESTRPVDSPRRTTVRRTTARVVGKLLRLLRFPLWAFLAGILCKSLPGAAIVFGWTLRRMRRTIRRRLEHHLEVAPVSAEDALPSSATVRVRRRVGRTLRDGVLGTVGVMIYALPAGFVWSSAWYAGWNNSFNKGYEQAAVGPLLGLFGIVLFVAVAAPLLWMPSRFALTRRFRSFLDLRLPFRIWGAFPLRSLAATLILVVGSLPISLLMAAPGLLGNAPALTSMTDEELARWAGGYWFWTAVATAALFVATHLAIARLYADALEKGMRTGILSRDDVGIELRARALTSLRAALPETGAAPQRLRLRTTVAVAAGAVLWLGLVPQIFVGQFFNYRGPRGFFFQPVVSVPFSGSAVPIGERSP